MDWRCPFKGPLRRYGGFEILGRTNNLTREFVDHVKMETVGRPRTSKEEGPRVPTRMSLTRDCLSGFGGQDFSVTLESPADSRLPPGQMILNTALTIQTPAERRLRGILLV